MPLCKVLGRRLPNETFDRELKISWARPQTPEEKEKGMQPEATIAKTGETIDLPKKTAEYYESQKMVEILGKPKPVEDEVPDLSDEEEPIEKIEEELDEYTELKGKNVGELRAMAKKKGIPRYSKMREAELIAALMDE